MHLFQILSFIYNIKIYLKCVFDNTVIDFIKLLSSYYQCPIFNVILLLICIVLYITPLFSKIFVMCLKSKHILEKVLLMNGGLVMFLDSCLS